MALAVGLIGMHHLVPDTAHPVPMSATTAAHISLAGPDCCPCTPVGHQCQAVLTAGTAVAPPTATLAHPAATHDVRTPLVAAAGELSARAPPASGARLSQLGVWRR
jgi:hypothetical protein